MAVLTINGVAVKTPYTMEVALQDLDASTTGRNQKGKMIRDRVVGGANAKRKINCGWNGLTQKEMSTLLQAMSGVSFDIRYPDPYTGHYETKRFYVGDRTAPVLHNSKTKDFGKSSMNNEVMWTSLSANFVEL